MPGVELLIEKSVQANSRRRLDASSDLISQLPQPILHQILYFVPIDDAARMAVVSKTWFQVWKTFPFLNFGRCLPLLSLQRNTILLPYVDQILSNRKNQCLAVDTFTLKGRFPENISSYLERWIGILRDLHVHGLCVVSYGKLKTSPASIPERKYITLPETILSAKSLNYLELGGFNMDSLCGNVVKWPLLQKLYLKEVKVSDDLIRQIVTNCCRIEDLQFRGCVGFKSLPISNLLKLRKFIIHTDYRYQSPKVDIYVQSLECFSYDTAKTQYCININSCTRLKSLFVTGRGITQDWVDKLFSLFPLLESLSLENCKMLVKVNISSCNLKHLRLSICDNLFFEVEANIDTSNLSTFVYSGNGALVFSLNAPYLLQANVKLSRKFTRNLTECAKVSKFLRAIGCSEVVNLSCFYIENLAFPEEIRDGLNYYGCELKNLSLCICSKPDPNFPFAALDLLAYLFRVYSQLDSLCIITNKDHVSDSLKLLYEKLRDKEEMLHCCDTLPIKCWRHFLQEVIFGTPERDEVQRHKSLIGGWDINKLKKLRITLNPR